MPSTPSRVDRASEKAVPASVKEIRAHFPALARREAGYPVGYFDGPGGTQVPYAVAKSADDYLFHHNANTHWAYPTSDETDRALAAAREALADFLGAKAKEIVFGANMTTLTYHLSRALGRCFVSGDEIIVTQLDHQANIAPWKVLEEERGVRTLMVPLRPETGTLDWTVFEQLVSSRTRLVAIGAASNALGTVSDLARASALARNVGALVFVDAVHYAPHRKVEVDKLDCDLLTCSAYKFYGPHVGVLWGRENLLGELEVPKLPPAPDYAPERWETGTLNHEGVVGAAAAIDFLASLAPGDNRNERLGAALEVLHKRGELLVERLWRGLTELPSVRVFGPPPGEPRTPTVSFVVGDIPSRELAAQLSSHFGLFLSHGDFYASTVTAALGVEKQGLLRAGCACYTSEEEVDRLIEAVRLLA